MFTILTPDQFVTSAWKNGGGVAHEIARKETNGKWLWRLSIAEVASDGPFSRFENLSRILTVIEGNGIDLHSPDAILNAPLLTPVRFSGDLPIEGKLINGPIRDFNIIYDADVLDVAATVITGSKTVLVSDQRMGYLSVAGETNLDDQLLPVGAFALGAFSKLQTSHGTSGILVTLKARG